MPKSRAKTIDDLKKAIRAVGRTAGEDAERAGIIERARTLGEDALIPAGWASDGALRDGGAWTAEQRETANDIFAALEGAVDDAYPDRYCWVCDWYGSGQDGDPWTVVFRLGGDLWAAPYDWDDAGKVQLGEAVKVRPVTTYVERDASPLLEWRRRKIADLKGLERRRIEFSTAGMELREKDDDTWTLTGFACVTDTPYEVGFYTETIRRGAFKRTLGEQPDVQLLVNHEGLPLARTRSGTLRLEERTVPDDSGRTGLWVEADLDKRDPDAQRLEFKMRRGDVDAMSFAFQATDQDWNDTFTDRQIKAVSIHRGDVSVVNQGANPAASASIRSQDAMLALRRAGADTVLAALVEWRDHTLQPLEERAGKTLSAATMEILSNVLNLVATADEAVDEAQPLLAELMGVPNPDDDAAAADDETVAGGIEDRAARAPLPDYTTRAAQELALLEMRR